MWELQIILYSIGNSSFPSFQSTPIFGSWIGGNISYNTRESELPSQSEKNIYLYAPFFTASLTQQIYPSQFCVRAHSPSSIGAFHIIYKNVRRGLGNLAALSSVSAARRVRRRRYWREQMAWKLFFNKQNECSWFSFYTPRRGAGKGSKGKCFLLYTAPQKNAGCWNSPSSYIECEIGAILNVQCTMSNNIN